MATPLGFDFFFVKFISEFHEITRANTILELYHVTTYVMLSGSVAHAPTALVTLTSSAWLVLVSRLTMDGMPPAFLMIARLAGI